MWRQILQSIPASPRNMASMVIQITVVAVYSIIWEITDAIRAGCGLLPSANTQKL